MHMKDKAIIAICYHGQVLFLERKRLCILVSIGEDDKQETANCTL